ncbi:MAG: S6e family ribosomal protein [Candidatus Woesearchaeota archaeon]
MAIKCVIGDPKTGKSKQVDIELDDYADKKIGDTITLPQFDGYTFVITGGSDSAGFPMRFDVDTPKKRILAQSGIGVHTPRKGMRVRKMVAGKFVTDRTAQINVKVATYGKAPLWEEESKEGEQA